MIGKNTSLTFILLLWLCGLSGLDPLLAQGTSLLTRRDWGVGSSPQSVTAGDFNGDGRPDLAVANAGADTVSILLGNGDGTFRAAQDFAVGRSPQFVTVGDFNGDGRTDLAVANAGSGDVSILLGNGDGTFQTAQQVKAGHRPLSITVSDLNSDGRMDLAVANAGSNDVSILLGNGDGTFRAARSVNVGYNPSSLIASDLNGDGRPDLAVANYYSNTVSVPLGAGDGRFASTPALAKESDLPLADAGDDETSGNDGDLLDDRIARVDWVSIRGVNFIPSYASNTYEIWRNYNHDVFDNELRLVKEVGYNSVRLWLNYRAYEELGTQAIDRIEDALRLCVRYGLSAVMTVFDSVGIRQRADARWMNIVDAYDQFLAGPRFTEEEKEFMQIVFERYVKGVGKHLMVPVGSDSPLMILAWQNWQSTPGNDKLGPESYRNMENYVSALMGRLRGHPNVLAWDLMNEPEFADEGPFTFTLQIHPEMERKRDAFLQHMRDFIKRTFPNEILTIGWADVNNCERYQALSDVLTFHDYSDPAALRSILRRALGFARGFRKPVFITETLGNWDLGSPTFGTQATDQAQLAHYQRVVPELLREPIGWMGWGMIVSRLFNPSADIFYPNGYPRPAAVYLERMLKQQ